MNASMGTESSNGNATPPAPSSTEPGTLALWSILRTVSALGVVTTLCILGGFGLGLWADSALGTGRTGVLLGTAVGTLLGFYAAYRTTRSVLRTLFSEDAPNKDHTE